MFSDRYSRFVTAAVSQLKRKWLCIAKGPGATYFNQGVTSQVLAIKIDGSDFSYDGNYATLRRITSSMQFKVLLTPRIFFSLK